MDNCFLGVDAGVSAVKLAWVRGGSLLRSYRIERERFCPQSLRTFWENLPSGIAVTGMGAAAFSDVFDGIPVRHVDEFQAIAAGALHLSGLDRALAVSVGTGTAFVYAERGKPAVHLGGSGVGGGTLLGLGQLLDGTADAEQLGALAAAGDLRHIDLCIGDVTDREIAGLPTYTTVANFAHLRPEASPADRARGIFNLVCQTVGMLSVFASRAVQTADIVLIGTPVVLPAFGELIGMVERLHGVKFTIPADAPYASAVGATLAAFGGN